MPADTTTQLDGWSWAIYTDTPIPDTIATSPPAAYRPTPHLATDLTAATTQFMNRATRHGRVVRVEIVPGNKYGPTFKAWVATP